MIRLDFFKPATLAKEVAILGKILGKEKEAAGLAAWYGDHLNHIHGFLEKRSAGPKVYIEGDSSYHTAAPGSGGHDMCVFSGGSNIAEVLSIPYPEVTSEWIVTANPDVVVKVTTKSAGGSCYSMADARNFKAIRTGIMDRPAWSHINAVKRGRIHLIANEIWTGPRAVIGMYYLVKWFFPDASQDFYPAGLHREYLEKFQKIPYQGVYVYPE
ncbi:MAG: ABC transporter substrate-binding protein [Desulfobacter sp.]|nr:ABC transporter substrate-binding protein [Desulfobacter sp.]